MAVVDQTCSDTATRLGVLQRWFYGGGVLLMTYEMFRSLALTPGDASWFGPGISDTHLET